MVYEPIRKVTEKEAALHMKLASRPRGLCMSSYIKRSKYTAKVHRIALGYFPQPSFNPTAKLNTGLPAA